MIFVASILLASGQSFSVALNFDPPLPPLEASQIQTYLEDDQRNLPAPLLLKRVHRDLDLLHRFAERSCRLEPGATRLVRCQLRESPRVRHLRVEGALPYSILQSELLRRAVLRPGKRFPIKEYEAAGEEATEDHDPWRRLKERIQERLAAFIDSQGFTGTKVKLQVLPLKKEPGRVDVIIQLDPGEPHRWGEVTIQGLVEKDKAGALSRIRRFGGQFREQSLQVRLEREEVLLRKRGYVEAHADYELKRIGGQIDALVTFQLGPILVQTFHGRLLAPRALLQSKTTFFESRSAGPRQLEASSQALRSYYQRRGYFRPEIVAHDPEEASLNAEQASLERQAKAILADSSRDRREAMAQITQRRLELRERRRQMSASQRQKRHIAFHINPGRPSSCSEVRIAGIPRRLQREIQAGGILATKPPVPGRHDGYILDQDLEADRNRIKIYLEERGWLVSDVSTVLREQSSGQIQVVFAVIAGEPSYIRSISVVGASDGEEDDDGKPTPDFYEPLMAALGMRPGSPFLESTAEDLRNRTLRFYRVRGYPTTEVEVNVELLADGVSARLFVQEGRRVLFGGMILSGMDRTRRDKIEEVFTAKPGEPFDPQEFYKGAANLRSWRVFRRISVQFLGLEAGRERVWVNISVEESASQTLDLTLGFSIEDYFQLALRFRDRNILGRAWSWDTLGAYGLIIGRRSSLRSTLKMPRLLGANTDFSLEPRILYREPSRPALWDDDFLLQRHPENLLILRAAAKVAHRFSPFTTLKADYAYALEVDKTGEETVRIRTGSTTLEANWLKVDNPFNPHQGLQLRGAVKLAAPYFLGDSYFLSTVGQAAAYLPLGRSTLATNLRGGSVLELEEDAKVPPSDLFRLGGDRSVRGFSQDWVRVTHPGAISDEEGRDGHANFFAMGSLEWRIPVGTQTAGGGMAVSLFSDLGWVATELDGPAFTSNYGWSNGLAFNYVLPIGPVGLVVAHQTISPTVHEDYDPERMPEPSDYQLAPLPQALNRFGYHLTMGYVF